MFTPIVNGKKEGRPSWGVAKILIDEGWANLVRRARARIGQQNLGMPEEVKDKIPSPTVWEKIPALEKKSLDE